MCDVNVVYGVSMHVVTGTGSDTGSDTDISPHISPQTEMFANADLHGLSTENWPYHTGHIVTYRANITID